MAIAGKGGAVKVGAVKVAEVKNWKLDIEADMLETTSFDSNGWKTFVAGLKAWSGTFDLEWKVSTDTTGQKALQDALLGGTTVSLVLDVNGTNNYSGTAFMKKEGLETPVDGVVTGSFDYQGTAALTYT
jgi:predicted secreted protein